MFHIGMGGPPPPPGFGPPPPGFGPPPVMANQPKPKPTNLSSKPLKSFNWAKIAPLKVEETIWKGLDDEKIHKALKGEIYSEFEDLFAANETKQAEVSDLNKNLGINLLLNKHLLALKR